jgi:hypothetical protein
MAQIVQEAVKDNKRPSDSPFMEVVSKFRPRQKFRESIKNETGRYLYDIAQLWDAMDYEADERLLRYSFSEENGNMQQSGNWSKSKKWEPPLHIRRTLDQSYFSMVEDTADRDTDQVVYRQTRMRKEKHHKEENEKTGSSRSNNTPGQSEVSESNVNLINSVTSATTSTLNGPGQNKKKITKLVGVTRVVMVDQLWLWILGESEIHQTYEDTEDFDRLIRYRYNNNFFPSTLGQKQT